MTSLRRLSYLLVLMVGFLSGAGLIGFFSAGWIYDYSDSLKSGRLPEVDAIVCLAGGKGRIPAAVDLWMRLEALHPDSPPLLYLSGLGHQATWKTVELQLQPRHLKKLKPEHVFIEAESTNTVENALWFKNYAITQGFERIILTTSSYHMRRSLLIFRNALGRDFQIETFTFKQPPFDLQHWRTDSTAIRITLTEYLKWIYAWFSFT